MPFDIPSEYLALVGIAIVIMTLMLQLRSRSKKTAKQKQQEKAAVKAAWEAEKKRAVQTGKALKSTAENAPLPDRMPLGEPLGTPFTGAMLSKHIAKAEIEIHQLGREIIGRIDSKMVALQTLTLEANRTANRLEILVEHFEQLYANNQHSNNGKSENEKHNVIPIAEAAAKLDDAEPLADVLEELQEDIANISKVIRDKTVLKTASPQTDGVLKILEPVLTPTPVPRSLSLDSLYHAPANTEQPSVEVPKTSPQLDVRKEVEVMSNYGYTPEQIASSLGITVEEVELVQKLRNDKRTI
ncbi:hypothetical protein FACS1894170_01020 [Planctomycetales bacterium]|nr:hypothetical protein FACS1894170_01020 [Planctomycetales bacterium]